MNVTQNAELKIGAYGESQITDIFQPIRLMVPIFQVVI